MTSHIATPKPTDWTVLPKPSIYDNVICIEKPNIKKLMGYLHNGLARPYDKGGFTNTYHTDEAEHLGEYLKRKAEGGQHIKTSHHMPKKSKYNRTIPEKYASLSVFRRSVRHTVSKDIYIDIDMQNAQPTIVCAIAGANNYPLPHLSRYVDNRADILTQVQELHNVDKSTAKQLFITLITGGTYEWWIKQNDDEGTNRITYLDDLERELVGVRGIIYEANPKIKDEVAKLNPEYSPEQCKKAVFAKWYFTIERTIQETAITYLLDNHNAELKYIIPCQDGFMILKDVWYTGIIDDINSHILATLHIPITFTVKPFDEVIPDCPEYDVVEDWYAVLSDKQLADVMYELYGKSFRKYNGILFVYRNNRWYEEADASKRFMTYQYISEDLYKYMKPKLDEAFAYDIKMKTHYNGILRTNTSNLSHIKTIITHLEGLIPVDATDIFNKQKHLLGFNNGVYDITAQDFRDYTYEDYITVSTGWDYEEPDFSNPKTAELQQTLTDIFLSIQPNAEQQQLLLTILASGLDGHPYQNAVIWQGQGGNGKGLLGNLMSKTLGGYYYKPSASILKDMAKSGAPSSDIIKMKNKRFIDIEEVGGHINTSLMRNLTGGGSIEARQLYQNSETFNLSSLFVLEINNAFQLDGKPQQADYRRYILIDFKTNFTDDERKIDKVITGIQYRRANHYYETEEFQTSIRPIFFLVLTNVYQQYYNFSQKCLNIIIPDCVRENTNQYLTEQDTAKRLFDYCFKKVDDPTKKMPITKVWDAIKKSDRYLSLSFTDKRAFSRDEIYKYIRELYNIPHNPNNHKPVNVCGIEAIDIDADSEPEEEAFAT